LNRTTNNTSTSIGDLFRALFEFEGPLFPTSFSSGTVIRHHQTARRQRGQSDEDAAGEGEDADEEDATLLELFGGATDEDEDESTSGDEDEDEDEAEVEALGPDGRMRRGMLSVARVSQDEGRKWSLFNQQRNWVMDKLRSRKFDRGTFPAYMVHDMLNRPVSTNEEYGTHFFCSRVDGAPCGDFQCLLQTADDGDQKVTVDQLPSGAAASAWLHSHELFLFDQFLAAHNALASRVAAETPEDASAQEQATIRARCRLEVEQLFPHAKCPNCESHALRMHASTNREAETDINPSGVVSFKCRNSDQTRPEILGRHHRKERAKGGGRKKRVPGGEWRGGRKREVHHSDSADGDDGDDEAENDDDNDDDDDDDDDDDGRSSMLVRNELGLNEWRLVMPKICLLRT